MKTEYKKLRLICNKRDELYWLELKNLIKKHNLSIKSILKQPMVFIQRRDLVQTIAYYKLFSKIKSKPGSIIEVGVFMGNGLFTWAKLMETFFPGDRGRKVYGFDNFSGYEKNVSKVDKHGIRYIKKMIGDFKIGKSFVDKMVTLHNMDNLIPGVERVKIYAGALSKTIPKFLKNEAGVRVSLLLIDLNLYAPTKTALSKLFSVVVPGGIVALRGYGVKPWEGESQAVDEFLKKNQIKKIHKFTFSPYPAIYFYK